MMTRSKDHNHAEYMQSHEPVFWSFEAYTCMQSHRIHAPIHTRSVQILSNHAENVFMCVYLCDSERCHSCLSCWHNGHACPLSCQENAASHGQSTYPHRALGFRNLFSFTTSVNSRAGRRTVAQVRKALVFCQAIVQNVAVVTRPILGHITWNCSPESIDA
eukprot:364352-Chlamydomonas_euryale.AAC.4